VSAPTTTYREGRIPPPPMPYGQLELQPPPPLYAGEGAAGNALMTAVPMLGSIGSVIFVAASGQGAKGYLAAGMFLLASLGFVAVSLWRARAGKTSQIMSDRREYLNYLRTIREVARSAAREQRQHLTWIHPAPTALAAVAADRTRVWERAPEDPDYLLVRYATGPQRLGLDLQPPESDTIDKLDPVAASALHRLLATHRVLPDLPTAVALGSFARIEITGGEDHARAQARALLAQAALMHAPDQLVIAVLAPEHALPEWDWVKWLPHAQSRREADAAGPRRLLCSDLDELMTLLPADLSERPRFGPGSGAPIAPHVVIVVDSVYVPPGHSVITEDGVQGMTIIDIPERWEELTDETRVRLHLEEDLGSERVRVAAVVPRQEPIRGFSDQMSIPAAEALARRLAPLYAGEGPVREDALTRNTELTDLLGIGDIYSISLDKTWRPRPPRDRLRVPIGVGADGHSISLDIKESAQQGMGPHGLVIGATGSGKSELLRTLVLGLALTHSPEILNLVLVDFKGGATFAGMAGMPHVSAIITNLADELTLVDRMQDALSGEMTRRQELLRASGNYASLRDYEKARTSGDAPHLKPLPSLLIVCDEFSELLSAKPEFVDLFVAIGRLGRSLGIHLLLASQRLEEGRLRGLDSHLSYRIGLRTFSAGESRSVIGVGDAYELPAIPGLGFLKPDQSSLWRFKAAYVSGPPRPRAGAGAGRSGRARREALPFVPGIVVSRLETEQLAAQEAAEVTAVAAQEKRAVFDIAVAAMEGHGPAAHQVWLPPLDVPDTFDALMPDLAIDPELGLVSKHWRQRGTLRFPLGAVDMPREQKRDLLVADLSGAAGHVAVVGSPRTGKSTLLRSMVTGLALTHTPREVQFYVLDFGGGTFTGMRDLPHVAGIGTRSEPDVVSRIVAEVESIADGREQFFRANGIDTIETYRTRRSLGEVDDGYGDVFLVVDGWSTVRADFEDLEVELQTLAQRSLTFGVHLVTSATRWMDYRTGIRDILGSRYELRLGDAMDSEIDRRVVANIPADRPGRGVMMAKYHFLAALPRIDGDPDAGSLGAGVTKLVTAVKDAWQGPPGPKLRLLPTKILMDEVRQLAPDSDHLLLGINEKALAPLGIDVERDPHLLVFGDGQSGKSNVLRAYMHEITRLYTPEKAQLFIVDYRRANLGEFPEEWVAGYCTNADTTTETVDGLAEFLTGRLPGADVTPDQLRNRSWWTGREAFLIVDDYELVATSLVNPCQAIIPLLAQAVDIGLHVVIARRSGGAGRSYDNLITALRDMAQPGLLLSGDPSEGALVGQLRPVPGVPGRGRLLTRDGYNVMQVGWQPSAHE